MTSDPDGWKYVVAIWIKQSLPEALRPYANKFEVMISEFCEPLMHFLSFPGRTVLPQVPPFAPPAM